MCVCHVFVTDLTCLLLNCLIVKLMFTVYNLMTVLSRFQYNLY